MKTRKLGKFNPIGALAVVAAILVMLAGCGTPQENPIQSVGITATQTSSGNWAGGLTVTFKGAPPDWVRYEIQEAGAIGERSKTGDYSFHLNKLNWMDEKFQRAIAAAATVPGVVIKDSK